jgi:hypothetical protein
VTSRVPGAFGRHDRWSVALAAGLAVLSLQGVATADERNSQSSTSDKSRSKKKATDKKAADKNENVRVSDNASRHFSQGVRYLTSQDPEKYEKAYREFKTAYADSPSWKILGNLGIVAHELERDGEAIDAFKAYLERSGKELSAEERKQFKEDLEVVEAGHSTVTIESEPEGAWIVDERLPETGVTIVNRYGPTSGKLELRVRAGHHRIVAELSGYVNDVWEFSDTPGSTSRHRFDLRRERPPAEAREDTAPPVEVKPDARLDTGSGGGSSAARVSAYFALGLGVAGAGVGTYFLLDAFDKRSHADDVFADCEAVSPGCGPQAALRSEAKAAEAAESSAFRRSMLTYVASGVLAATGVVLFIVSSPGSSSEAGRHASDGEARLVPWLSPQGVGMSGRF